MQKVYRCPSSGAAISHYGDNRVGTLLYICITGVVICSSDNRILKKADLFRKLDRATNTDKMCAYWVPKLFFCTFIMLNVM